MLGKQKTVLVTFALLCILFLVGTFGDWKMAEAVYRGDSALVKWTAALIPVVAYFLLSMIGGMLFQTNCRHTENKILKGFLFVTAFGTLFVSAFMMEKEFTSPDGLHDLERMLSLCITVPASLFAFVLGNFYAKTIDRDTLWEELFLMIFLAGFMIAFTMVAKEVFHRPRYFALRENLHGLKAADFCRFYESSPKEATYSGEIDIFDSFPSGHTGCAALLCFFLPFFMSLKEKTKKFELPAFFFGLAVTLFVGYTRMRVGSHFLTDVLTAILTVFVAYGFLYIVYFRKKWNGEKGRFLILGLK